jgi:hypothetical protein
MAGAALALSPNTPHPRLGRPPIRPPNGPPDTYRLCPDALGLELAHELRRVVISRVAVHCDGAAQSGESETGRFPDAAGRARDEGEVRYEVCCQHYCVRYVLVELGWG